MPGSASGLRNSPCITAPDTASALPTQMPITRRGARMSHSTTRSVRVSASPCASLIRAPHNDVPDAPTARLASDTSSSNRPSQMCARRAVLRLSTKGA